jgi:hypothetical protein
MYKEGTRRLFQNPSEQPEEFISKNHIATADSRINSSHPSAAGRLPFH